MIKNALKEHTISLYNGNFFFQLGFSARNRKTETAQGPLGKSGFNKGLSAYNIFNRLEEWESGGHPATSCIKALAPPQRSGAAATPATPLPQSQPRQAHQAGGEHGIQLLPTPGLRKPICRLCVTVSPAFPRCQEETSPWQELNCIQTCTARE